MIRLELLKANVVILFSACLGLSYSVNASELGDQLSQAFKARISYLDRELMTFRYETKEEFEPKTLADIKGRLKFKSERFFKKSLITPNLMAGPGTYVAIDPFFTRSYGGDDPQLYVLPLKKGSAILDLQTGFTPSERALVKLAHDQLQCKKEDDQLGGALIPETDMTFFTLRNSMTEACRTLAIEVVTNLNAQAIMYPYYAANDLSDCRHRNAAFNIVSASPIDFERSAVYTDTSLLENFPLSSLVKSIYEESATDFFLNLVGGKSQKMPLKLHETSSANEKTYSTWKERSILNCGPRWSLEGSQPGFPEASRINFNANYKDLEIQELILKFKNTFETKSLNKRYFQLAEFYKIAKISYLASGLPDEAETFKKWTSLQRWSYLDTPRTADLLRLYGAEVSQADLLRMQSELNALVKVMKLDEIKSVDFLPRILSSFGIKEGYQVFIINQINREQGGILILSADKNRSLQENLSLSKELYKAALQSCIDIYANDAISFEDAQKTDCALLPM